MLQTPRRSVTRFFIPLIDVLTLLFCVFLVMPLAKGTGEDASATPGEDVKRLQAELDRLHGMGADEPERIRKELEELRQAKIEVLKDRIVPRILGIDDRDGKLYFQDADKGRFDITGPAAARELIERDRRRFGSKAEMVYVLQPPRDPNSDFPTLADVDRFKDWFKDVPFRLDEALEKRP